MPPTKQFYEFGPFRIDRSERLLLRDSQVIPLTPKVFDTLLVLVENSRHILTKDELMKMVWPVVVVGLLITTFSFAPPLGHGIAASGDEARTAMRNAKTRTPR